MCFLWGQGRRFNLLKDDLKVSFVIPGYKCDEFIERNIESIFDQDYQNYEIIVVLNGEWNTRKELLSKLSEKYKWKVNLQWLDRPGLANANNYGFSISTGDIISHLSSDLYLMPGALRNWIDAFHEHPEMGLVYSGYKLVSDNPLDIYYSDEFDRYHLECENFIDGANPVKRDKWKPFSTDLRSLIDWDWALSITDDGTRCYYIKEPLYYA
jgi:glycosyltransferase involved in cell wall biosynthesis